MTTVSSPGGTPSIVYNREGLTIDTLAAAGTTQGTAAAITRYSGHTVVLLTPLSGGASGVILPSSAEIGDLVEIFPVGSGGYFVYPPSGGLIGTNSSANYPFQVSTTGLAVKCRLVQANTWIAETAPSSL